VTRRSDWEAEVLRPFQSEKGERRATFETPSGIPVAPLYDPDDAPGEYASRLGYPAEYPFTRGIYPNMFRGRLWTMRQYAGFGTAHETNERFRYLLESGQTGLSVAFDLPTQMGLDSDHPMAEGEVGRVGVAIDTVDDMNLLFDRIPLDAVSTSMTINATAPILLALYIALADDRGIPRGDLRGTVQNDILKEFIARGTYIYPVESSLRLVTDMFEFCSEAVPRWNPISISGYHMREAGATAVQEVAFTFANALEYVERALARQIPLQRFAPRLSFFFAAHNNLLEEVAKFRAARRLWAKLMRERYEASDDSCRLRFHTQTGGSTLTAQQPLNNVIRVAVQALSAVLGGTQSLHTNSYDEALQLPSQEAARLALRTQQVIALESGVADTVDPLGGAFFIEALTDQIEAGAMSYIARIEEIGGAASAIDFMAEEIHRSAYRYQRELEAGAVEVVGLNAFVEDEPGPGTVSPDFGQLAAEQKRRLAAVKASRDDGVVERQLGRLEAMADSSDNILPGIIDAVKARTTVGEISQALRNRWGQYDAS
jgi:methylmalonyl-CoA mutase N-terminal domain/subunit